MAGERKSWGPAKHKALLAPTARKHACQVSAAAAAAAQQASGQGRPHQQWPRQSQDASTKRLERAAASTSQLAAPPLQRSLQTASSRGASAPAAPAAGKQRTPATHHPRSTRAQPSSTFGLQPRTLNLTPPMHSGQTAFFPSACHAPATQAASTPPARRTKGRRHRRPRSSIIGGQLSRPPPSCCPPPRRPGRRPQEAAGHRRPGRHQRPRRWKDRA